MNDEKAAIINMVSGGVITSAEGLTLFKALCELEGMGSYESDVEVEDPRYLPPWESEGEEPHQLLGQNKCLRAIASANQQIISALQEGKLEDVTSKVSVLDVMQLSGYRPSPVQGNNGGFTTGSLHLKGDNDGLYTRGWGMWMSWSLSTDLDMPPTWGEPTLMQIFMPSRSLPLRREATEPFDGEREQIKVTSEFESLSDSVVTEAGQFDGCLKLRRTISPLGDAQFRGGWAHDINDSLRHTGTQYIWLAPGVGVVKFLHEHPNNTQTQIELVDCDIQDGEPLYFPLSLGNKWRYQWQDELTIHRELIRVILDKGDGAFTLSCANHITGIP